MSNKTKWDTARFQIGQRVKVTGCLERFPDFIVDSGSLGIVCAICEDNLWILLDEHVPGAAEWDNMVCILREFPEELDYVEDYEGKEEVGRQIATSQDMSGRWFHVWKTRDDRDEFAEEITVRELSRLKFCAQQFREYCYQQTKVELPQLRVDAMGAGVYVSMEVEGSDWTSIGFDEWFRGEWAEFHRVQIVD